MEINREKLDAIIKHNRQSITLAFHVLLRSGHGLKYGRVGDDANGLAGAGLAGDLVQPRGKDSDLAIYHQFGAHVVVVADIYGPWAIDITDLLAGINYHTHFGMGADGKIVSFVEDTAAENDRRNAAFLADSLEASDMTDDTAAENDRRFGAFLAYDDDASYAARVADRKAAVADEALALAKRGVAHVLAKADATRPSSDDAGLDVMYGFDVQELVEQVLNDNPDEFNRYKAGERALFGFFVGKAMRECRGKATAGEIGKVLAGILKQYRK